MANERTKGRVGVFTYQKKRATGAVEDMEAVLKDFANNYRLEPRLKEYEHIANNILADKEASESRQFNARSMLRGIERINEYLAAGNAEMAARNKKVNRPISHKFPIDLPSMLDTQNFGTSDT